MYKYLPSTSKPRKRIKGNLQKKKDGGFDIMMLILVDHVFKARLGRGGGKIQISSES